MVAGISNYCPIATPFFFSILSDIISSHGESGGYQFCVEVELEKK